MKTTAWYIVCVVSAVAVWLTIPILARVLPTGSIGIVGSYSILGFMALCVLICSMALYVMRRNHRVLYGVIEICGAIVLVWITFLQVYQSLGLEDALKVAAAVYFFIRGLDNIGEGFVPGSTWAQRWDRLFPKNQNRSAK